jgi:hypothetical protein
MTKLEIFRISTYFQWFISLLVILTSLISYFKRPNYIKALFYYGITSFTFSTLIQFIASRDNYLTNTYVFLETLILSSLYYQVGNSVLFRRMIIVGVISYVIFYSSAYLYFPTYVFSAIRVGRDLLLILFSVSYFIYLLRQLPEDDLLKFPMFWINSAIVVFFSGVFVLSYFRDYIVLVLKDDTAGFWAFRNFFSTAYWLVLAYAGWLNLKTIRATQDLN